MSWVPVAFIFAASLLSAVHAPLWLTIGCTFVGAGIAMYEQAH
jgi:hypothetical protein